MAAGSLAKDEIFRPRCLSLPPPLVVGAGPVLGYATLSILVPAADVWRAPGPFEIQGVDATVVFATRFRAHLDTLQSLLQLHSETAHNIAHFTFAEEDDAAPHHDVGIGTVK